MSLMNQAFERIVEEKCPDKIEILRMLGIQPSLFIINWVNTLYSRYLSLDHVLQLWDVYFIKGSDMLFRLALFIFEKSDFRNKTHDDIQASMCRGLDSIIQYSAMHVIYDSYPFVSL